MKLRIEEILKTKELYEPDLRLISLASKSELPETYDYLLYKGIITEEAYELIKEIWYTNKYQKTFALTDVVRRIGGSVVRSSRNKTSYQLKKLVKLGIMKVYKPNHKSYTLSLSSRIFAKFRNYLFSRFPKEVGAGWEKIVRLEVKEMKIKRTPIVLKARTPIVTYRKPIFLRERDRRSYELEEKRLKNAKPSRNPKARKINFNAKKYAGLSTSDRKQLTRLSAFGQAAVDRRLKQIRKTTPEPLTKDEETCLNEFVPYYENLICNTTGRIRTSLLGSIPNKKRSRLWTPVFKTFMTCKEKGYDWKIYLESQFEAFEHWENRGKLPYPMPNMMYTERAFKAYEQYIYNKETAYKKEGWKNAKVKSKNIGTYAQEVDRKLADDIERIGIPIRYQYTNGMSRTSLDSVKAPKKIMNRIIFSKAVQDVWDGLSVEFWSLIPNAARDLETKRGICKEWDDKLDQLKELLANSEKMAIIKKSWEETKLPKMYGLFEINRKIEQYTVA